MSNNYKTEWKKATGNLPWGVQRAFYEVLNLAKDGEITLVFGADYNEKGACLVNQATNLLKIGSNVKAGEGYGLPMEHFDTIVSLFDSINSAFWRGGINEFGEVSPFAAETLLRWAARPKPQPESSKELPYREPSDEEMQAELLKLFTTPTPVEQEANEPPC